MTEKKLSFNDKYMNVQSELNAPKNQFNKFGNYAYRSCEDIYNAVKPLLMKYQLVLTLDDELVLIGDRYYIKATARLTDAETKENVSNTSYAREEENVKGQISAQITGATSSYARKYALNGLFLIDDVKDADATNTHDKKFKNEEVENGIYMSWIDEFIFNHQEFKEGFFKKYNLKSVDDVKTLSLIKVDEIITGMKKILTKEQSEKAKEEKTGVYSEKETF